MKILTEHQIVDNWNKFLNIIETTFADDRKENINKIINHFQDRMILAPASHKEHYHGAHPGGYIEHVLNVYNVAMDLFHVWSKYSNNINYTIEEITLVSLFHDIGIVGDLNENLYEIQDNDWRKNNMGEIYKINQKIVNMNVADRSLYLLQHFDIKLTQTEWISIKIHSGLYDSANEYYIKTTFESDILKSNLPFLIHQADLLSTRIEYEFWKYPNNKLTQSDVIIPNTTNKLNTQLSKVHKSQPQSNMNLSSFFENNIKEPEIDSVYNEIDSLFED